MGTEWYNDPDYKNPILSPTAGMPLRRSPHRAKKVKQIHMWFSLVGFIAGVGAVVYAYNESSSIALAIFAFLVVNSYVGRGLGDVATDPEKAKRFVYFTVQPALLIGIFYGTYQWWGIMWLSAVLGVVIGLILWQLIGFVLLPEIHAEELQDTQERMASGGV